MNIQFFSNKLRRDFKEFFSWDFPIGAEGFSNTKYEKTFVKNNYYIYIYNKPQTNSEYYCGIQVSDNKVSFMITLWYNWLENKPTTIKLFCSSGNFKYLKFYDGNLKNLSVKTLNDFIDFMKNIYR